MKILVIVDCQEDFISGSLGSKEAQAIVPNVIEKIKTVEKGDCILLTQDEHFDSEYLSTKEGINLPVKHCIFNTDGIKINSDIMGTIHEIANAYQVYHKHTFGSLEMASSVYSYAQMEEVDQIEIVGLCTDICVVSNALILKAYLPEIEIVVDASCCAGVTPETHKAALTVMKSCQIKVINEH